MTNWWEGGKPDAVAPYTGGKLPGVDADGNGVVYPADGLSAGASIVREFPFAFDTPDLLTGAALYTPTPGDILLDAWIEIDTAWDGTTPFGDVGSFIEGNYGLAVAAINHAWDMTLTNGSDGSNSGIPYSRQVSLSMLSILGLVPQYAVVDGFLQPLNYNPPGVGTRRFTTADPIKVCVSQDGTNTGDDPGATVGAATLFLVTATPVGA